MILRLQHLEYVNSILIVLNSQQPRIDANLQKMLKNFYNIFGPDFKAHIAFVFTRWGTGKKDVKKRL